MGFHNISFRILVKNRTMNEYNLAVLNKVYFGILAPIFLGVVYFFEQNKQRLSCANLRPATLLSLLVLVNSEL